MLNKKILISIIIFLSTILIASGSYIGIKKFIEYKQKIAIEEINKTIEKKFSFQSCKKILNFDIENAKNNKSFKKEKYLKYKNNCDKKYNIKNIPLNLEDCKKIIKSDISNLEKRFIILDDFEKIQKSCSDKYLKVKFSTGSFFDVNNDFKTSINLNFSLDFFEDKGDLASKEYIENRINAKKRLISLLDIKPKVKISIDDIVLYPKKAIINLNLKPKTKYEISIKSYENKKIENKTKSDKLIFTTPENKFLGIILKNPVSLYQYNIPPRFEIVKYNMDNIKSINLKICRIDINSYSKIEIFKSRNKNNPKTKNFFINGIDNIKTKKCLYKEINLNTNKTEINYNQIWRPTRDGLYYITFTNQKYRNINNHIQEPILYGIINAHITMKISKNGEAFFFVNDFNGKPLREQNIRIYVNDFKDHTKKYNKEKKKTENIYNSPLDKNIFGKEIHLGLTDKNGILKVNLKDKIKNAFDKTFNDRWLYDYYGQDNSFFVKASSKSNLTYNNSKWNAGIAPWNFGYKINSYWGDNGDKNTPQLLRRVREEPKYYYHIYTDRKLYLPGEEVNIKAIIRNSKDLSIPKDNEFTIEVEDSKNKKIKSYTTKLSSFGSIYDKVKLSKLSPTGTYRIIIKDNKNFYGYSYFSVEVFKKPKFKVEVGLKTIGLNGEEVKIEKTEKISDEYYFKNEYTGKFKIIGDINAKYYNGANLANASYTYKVYKQYYYDSSYWDECYWGCYWEPNKQFYTEGKGILNSDGKGTFEVNVDFKSNYDDYKYIVEVTVKDDNQDQITSSNSIIARLPEIYKKWNDKTSLKFNTENKFYKVGTKILIKGGLNHGKWTNDYNDKYILIIKKKNYLTKYINDIRGYKRPINITEEKIIKTLLVNSTNFNITKEGKLEYEFIPKESGEYIFEYGQIDFEYLKSKKIKIENLLKEKNITDFIKNKEYFSIVTYGKSDAKNPIASDNKIRVLSEKISYHLGEKAKILVRLPFSKGKILWTVEKQGVVKKELININSNIFFKEILVDNTFIPNAYIGVVAIEVNNKKVPEYKVGYTEIVVDKTDKKSFINIKTNKKIYKPREKVILNIKNKLKNQKGKKAELTIMVVDDSLISLMGNVDLNSLEKFYKKLPFQIQTSLTNLAMLKNYYFSRPGIVGGSGFGNFKGGDSAVSTRTIFKNTAYYNPSIITDENGNAKVEFNLPDNLTNFRIMVVANSKDNFFGFGSKNIEVRKNIIIEDKTPLFYRAGDKIEIRAKIFNKTNKEIGFKVKFKSNDIKVNKEEKDLIIGANSSQIVSFWTSGKIDKNKDLKYKIIALGDSIDNSDIIEKTIENKEFPSINTILMKGGIAKLQEKQNFKIYVPENTDFKKSKVKISFSNNPLQGVEKIVQSLLQYPYGCIEQTTSSTYPNAIVLKYSKLFPGVIPKNKAKENLNYGIERIASMQVSNGGFAYWQGENQANLHITPYVLRRLIDMKSYGANIPKKMIDNATKYLEKNIGNINNNVDKAELFYTFSKIGKAELIYNKLLKGVDKTKFSRHSLIVYNYGLINWDKKENKDAIERNIKRIIKKLNDNKNDSRYWSKRSDKALFTSMLIDYGYDKTIINKYIKELYDIDWSNYYYSTTAKNNAFIAFAKYIEKYGNNNSSKFAFSIGTIHNRDKRFYLGEEQPNLMKREFILDDIIQYKEDYIELTTFVISGKEIFTNLTLEIVPKNKFKIKEISNGMKVERKIYEILNENKLEECSDIYNWYGNNSKTDCSKVLKEVTNGIYKRGSKYKISIKITFDSEKERRNIALEDYIPSTFKIINSKFKTESSALKKGNKQSWSWDHIEYLKDRIFANASYSWNKELKFEYIVISEFSGNFIYPPVNAYMMYNGDIKSHTKFKEIIVK